MFSQTATRADIAWFVDARTAMAAVIAPTVWKSFPFFTITILAALQSIPASLYEAARVDGATARQQFVHVTWPGIRRPALLAVLLNALWTFREFDIIYASTRAGRLAPPRRSASSCTARRSRASASAPPRRSGC